MFREVFWVVAFLGFLWVCEWVLFFFALLNRGQIGFLRGFMFFGVFGWVLWGRVYIKICFKEGK